MLMVVGKEDAKSQVVEEIKGNSVLYNPFVSFLMI